MARVREFDTEAAVAAAMAAFRSKGYAGTSIQDLADATGVGRGSLYAAFGSKEGLYMAAMDRYREQYATPLIEILHGGAPARELIREVLVGIVDELVRDGDRQACLIVGAATERAAWDPKIAAHLRGTTGSLEDALAEVISAAQDKGEVSDRQDARQSARFLLTFMQGLRVMAAIERDRRSLMSAVEVALRCLD